MKHTTTYNPCNHMNNMNQKPNYYRALQIAASMTPRMEMKGLSC